MAKRKLSYSDVPEGTPYVSVYCAGRAGPGGVPSHQDRIWRIATLYPDTDAPRWPDGATRWTEVIHQYWTADREVIVLNTAPTRVSLIGDRVVTRDEWRANPAVFDQGSRSKYRLPCGICSIAISVQAETLEPKLRTLLEIGVNEVSLVALAAKLAPA